MRRSLLYVAALVLATGCATSNPMQPSGPAEPVAYVTEGKSRPHAADCDLGPGYQNDDYRAEEDAR